MVEAVGTLATSQDDLLATTSPSPCGQKVSVSASLYAPEDVNAEERDVLETVYDRSSLLGRLTNYWLNPLLSLGHQRALVFADVSSVPRHYRARHNWLLAREQLHRGLGAREPLWRPLWRTYGRDFVLAGVLRFLGDLTGTAAPKLLNNLLTLIERKQQHGAQFAAHNDLSGYVLCVLLFLLYQSNSLCINGYFQMTMQLGFKCRIALQQALYRHSLTFGPHERTLYSAGKLINLISNDTGRIERSVMFLHYVWGGPLQILLIMLYLWLLLGWTSVIGLLVFCLCYPVQNWLVKRMTRAKNAALTLTDLRVKKMQEVVEGMRIIKFSAWEDEFLRQLERLRAAELYKTLNVCLYRSFITFLTTMGPVLSCLCTFAAYYWTHGQLPIKLILPAIAYFNALRLPLALLPLIVSMVSDAVVALRRMQQCLETVSCCSEPTVDSMDPSNAVESHQAVLSYQPIAVEDPSHGLPNHGLPSHGTQNHGTQSRSTQSNGQDAGQPSAAILLKLGELCIRRGELVAVIGPTGSGKSSLLSALIGELNLVSGRLHRLADYNKFGPQDDHHHQGPVLGGIPYCPQTAWIRNCSVRDNILQGLPFRVSSYDQVIRSCQLQRDLYLLPQGDATLIGDRGANLSGGQKHRVSMARAAYHHLLLHSSNDENAEAKEQYDGSGALFLADDPLAALDANVRKRVWRQLFCGLLKGATRIVCTHDDWLLPTVDRIVVLRGMQVTFQGSHAEYQQWMHSLPNSNMPCLDDRHDDGMGGGEEALSAQNKEDLEDQESEKKLLARKRDGPPPQAEAEDRATGRISRSVYWLYFLYCGGAIFLVGCLVSILLHQLTRIADSYWIINWDARHSRLNWFHRCFGEMSDATYFAVYVLWGFSQGFFSLLGALVFTGGGLRSARKHHQLAARGVVYAPISFVERNPSGRILNRFSRDVDALDNDLPEDLRSFVSTLGFVIAGFALIVVASWHSILALAPLAVASYFIQRYFRHSLRELKRIESVQRSPLYSNLTETYDGLSSIRSFRHQSFFIRRHEHAIDDVDAVSFVLQCMQRWIALRLETVGNVAVLVAAVFVFAWVQQDAGVAGVALVYSLSISGALNWSLRQFAEAEGRIISSERLLHYGTQLPSEEAKMETADATVRTRRQDGLWPSRGEIIAQNISLRYAEQAPPALRHLTFHIRPREKVGVVGRTGAGKSTLIAALYRLYEYDADGTLTIDGVECRSVGLRDLRRALTIIPQDPVVFSGTVRSNLDPLGLHGDDRLWTCLQLAHLKTTLRDRGLTLDSQLGVDVTLSGGQRQLLCLARALLHRTVIVVLDEATASIDPETDGLVQQCLAREFADCTVLTIAHRLSTILGYDRVFVFDGGQIVEEGPPMQLLQDASTRFHQLGREMGLVSSHPAPPSPSS